MSLTKEEYLSRLLLDISIAKENNRRGVFKINEKIPDEVAKYSRDFLIANTKYRVEFKKCRNCSRTWDIIIVF